MADPILDMIKGGAKIIDVRSPEEFEDEHFPNAVNIPVNVITTRLAEIGEKTAPLVLYCASGSRSAFAARILSMAGFKKVVNAGGLADMPGF
ncbi:MAG: rhodanese-like domain-containing protein [Spirochaetae bacterium HGW-Spirochaetae-7]|jgi:phage shock protein E|nr:MAG: rhodanese-like domain-containing protein [Spirochaetae bacterium HGW-Spirochaetae-7]